MNQLKWIYFLVLVFAGVVGVSALELAAPFSSHMVLQRDAGIPVWGTAAPREKVTVTFGGQQVAGRADQDGKWRVALEPMPAAAQGGELKVVGSSGELVLQDVLVGDVWVATGQSNMRWRLKDCTGGREAAAAADDTAIRVLNYEGTLHPGGQKYSVDFLKKMTIETYYQAPGWQAATSKVVPGFSGVGYHFARRLRESVDVPIGVVHFAVGGSPIEAHIPREAMERSPLLRDFLGDWFKNEDYPQWCRQRAAHNVAHWLADPQLKKKSPPHPFAPHFLWDAGVARFLPLPVKGVLWYQGESNATVDGGGGAPVPVEVNRDKFEVLVRAWRAAWKNDKLPVYHVQLPGLNRPWAPFREAQLEATRRLDNVGMAVAIDVGHPTDVHPRNKKPVGERLALLALSMTYGEDVVANGPLYKRSVFKNGRGFIDFEFSQGMRAADGGDLVGFEIAGRDKVWHPAAARVSNGYIEVASPEVRDPIAVRYGWANDPVCNLVNEAGLPASPFRTDDWDDVKPSGNVERGQVKRAKTAPKRDVIRVACIGDSITFGSGIANRGENSYPARLQKLLGDRYEVRNFGNPGRGVVKKSMRGKQKRAFLFMKEHQDALKFEPHIVICNLGINDIMDWKKFGKDDFVGDYRELLQQYKALNTYPRVLVWGPLAPLFPGQKFFGDPGVEEINQAIAKAAAAEQVTLIDMAKPLAGHPEWFPDHIHPNADGAKVIAETVSKVIQE
ncbi:GDSL-type esterase/lipase family protein [Sulfuriroseicoccus oceanibius]|uniref:Uncharacterized protein n=1 Tax=Sulfuriroseicoccus oceanibius TaxID=2707525 RepID=A0A6B3L6T9_9BACT|nr:GDSL-type esterase/lipase family protein [Sulfuriroseicoccus oceanibius]QQL45022.1 hypothetical protein G3M56_000085 [Sulfuriroseicoccus oceanibius]